MREEVSDELACLAALAYNRAWFEMGAGRSERAEMALWWEGAEAAMPRLRRARGRGWRSGREALMELSGASEGECAEALDRGFERGLLTAFRLSEYAHPTPAGVEKARRLVERERARGEARELAEATGGGARSWAGGSKRV